MGFMRPGCPGATLSCEREDHPLFERKMLAPGVYITTLDAEKFNRCRIAIHLRYTPLRRTATDAAVLPGLLLKLWSSPATSEKTRYLPYFPVSQSGTGKTAQQLLA